MIGETAFREARPTEYKGVLFRSKSEAIVARSLDIQKEIDWEYEPPSFKQADGWTPDFILQFDSTAGLRWKIALEYKPSRPTAVYLDELWKRFRPAYDEGWLCGVLVGSPFLPAVTPEFYIRISKGWPGDGWMLDDDRGLDFLYSDWSSALKYRFDLLQSPGWRRER